MAVGAARPTIRHRTDVPKRSFRESALSAANIKYECNFRTAAIDDRIKVLSLVIGTALSLRDILVQAVVSYF
jgi:hypothetical protein